MHKIQSYFYTILLFVALAFIPMLANAEDGVVPSEKLQGLWAAPDCNHWENLQYYSNHFIIDYDSDAFQIEPMHTLLTKREYRVISTNGKKKPIRILEDGVLQHVDIEDNANFSDPWDKLPIIRYHEYMHCLDIDLPEIISQLVELSPRLDSIYPHCQYTISNECIEHSFQSYLPENKTDLTLNEIKQVFYDIGIISQANNKVRLEIQELDEIAEIIFSIIDADNSNTINLIELKNTKTIWTHPQLTENHKKQLVNVLKEITIHFPAFNGL